MDQDPIKTAMREARRQKRFSTEYPICFLCPESDLETLTPVTLGWLEAHGMGVPRILIELHHHYGEAHDPNLIVPLCLNCHRKVTEGLAKEGVGMKAEVDTVVRTVLMLDADAAFFEKFAASRRRMADDLRKTVQQENSNDGK